MRWLDSLSTAGGVHLEALVHDARSRMRTRASSNAARDEAADGATTRYTSLAQALGWFSIGLGVAELAAPRRVSEAVGADANDANLALVRALGLRELVSGLGILSQRGESGWLWSRVAGDVMDLALLGSVMKSSSNGERRMTAAATAAVLGVALADAAVARARGREKRYDRTRTATDAPRTSWKEDGQRHSRASVTINRPLEEVSRRWERTEGDTAGLRRLREAEISLCPAPRHGQTEVHALLDYESGNAAARLVRTARHRSPGQQLREDLRHFKQLVETGDIMHSDASIHRGMHPGRPDAEVSV